MGFIWLVEWLVWARIIIFKLTVRFRLGGHRGRNLALNPVGTEHNSDKQIMTEKDTNRIHSAKK